MNALFALLLWFSSFLGFTTDTDEVMPLDSNVKFQAGQQIDMDGLHQVNVNPRTVVALEDTHFRPAK